MSECKIALIEDDLAMGESMLARFELEGWPTCLFKTCCEAELNWQKLLAADVVISDLRLPDGSGAEIFARYLERGGSAPYILITAYAALPDAIQLMRDGLNDYWPKPFDIEDAVRRLSLLLDDREHTREAVLGHCRVMQQVERMLEKIAPLKINVFITGETGTGKEEAVKFMHAISASDAPLVAVNSGAIPHELLESELFGHEKGAFTGAIAQKIGCIERAHGGTLFLDEIGDMSLGMQVKLLRVIQNGRMTRVGGSTEIQVNFRLVCATHRNLKQMVEQGMFREDLYYRINVVHVELPPLRERDSDMLWLAMKFIEQADDNPSHVRGLLPMAEQLLLDHAFPGNVRELKNRIERAVALTGSQMLSVEDIFPDQVYENAEAGDANRGMRLKDLVSLTERRAIEHAYEASGRTVIKAAEILGISRKTLWEKAKKLNIDLH